MMSSEQPPAPTLVYAIPELPRCPEDHLEREMQMAEAFWKEHHIHPFHVMDVELFPGERTMLTIYLITGLMKTVEWPSDCSFSLLDLLLVTGARAALARCPSRCPCEHGRYLTYRDARRAWLLTQTISLADMDGHMHRFLGYARELQAYEDANAQRKWAQKKYYHRWEPYPTERARRVNTYTSHKNYKDGKVEYF